MSGRGRLLLGVLERAQRLGLLGPRPVTDHLRHAEAYLEALPAQFERGLDLGSGAGVPGLVLAMARPTSRWVLLDGRERCTRFLRAAVAQLDLAGRVRVLLSRAEEAGRDPELRAGFEVVVTRGLGPPSVAAECGSPFLQVGGVLVVSEPPNPSGARWPAEGIARVGLAAERQLGDSWGHMQVLRQVTPCPPAYPRRVGIPAKRPLFS